MLSRYFLFSVYIFLIASESPLDAQNLIRDPGFESVRRIFDGSDHVYVYDSWTSLLSFKKLSPRGLPIYSEYAAQNMDDKYLSYWIPYEGDSYMFSHIVYFRNLYQTRLTEDLEPGNSYKIRFKYKILSNSFSPEKIESSIEGKIGIMFTSKDMSDSSGLKIMNNHRVILRPQIVIEDFQADSIFKWVEHTVFIKPQKAYSYLTIGNFQGLIEAEELKYYPVTGIGYRIDEVYVEKVPSMGEIKNAKRKKND